MSVVTRPVQSYKLEVDLDAAQNKPDAGVIHNIDPFLSIAEVEICSKVTRVIHPCRFCISDIGDIIDMAYSISNLPTF